MKHRFLLGLVASLMLTGCYTSSISSKVQKPSTPIKTIAISPSSGMFGDAVGIELSNEGFIVIDGQQSAALLVTAGMNELQVYRPETAKPIIDKGVDAILVVKATIGYDGSPDNATVKLVNLKDGKIIVGANWQNGGGGARTSAADSIARTCMAKAAANIAETIGSALR